MSELTIASDTDFSVTGPARTTVQTFVGEPMPTAAKKSISSRDELPIDVNEASAQDLRQALPGIGEKLALRIVAYREEHGPFSDPSELSKVPGVSEGRLSKIAPRV